MGMATLERVWAAHYRAPDPVHVDPPEQAVSADCGDDCPHRGWCNLCDRDLCTTHPGGEDAEPVECPRHGQVHADCHLQTCTAPECWTDD